MVSWSEDAMASSGSFLSFLGAYFMDWLREIHLLMPVHLESSLLVTSLLTSVLMLLSSALILLKNALLDISIDFLLSGLKVEKLGRCGSLLAELILQVYFKYFIKKDYYRYAPSTGLLPTLKQPLFVSFNITGSWAKVNERSEQIVPISSVQ